jgi:hypothetical protein
VQVAPHLNIPGVVNSNSTILHIHQQLIKPRGNSSSQSKFRSFVLFLLHRTFAP